MKAFMSYRHAVVGLAALALVFTVSCGSKKGGGGTATPADTNASSGDCSTSTSKCKLGQKYSSGVFLGAGTGENQYGYDQNISLYLGFFAKDAKAVDKDDDYVSYNGDVTANGTLKIAKGAYGALTKPAPERMISALTFDFYIDFFGGGGNNNDYDYSYPDYGYNDDYYGGGNNCPSYGCNQPCYSCGNDDYDDDYNSSQCKLPNGTYKVATTTAGDWYDGYYSQVSNLKLKITGSSKTIVATFNGYLEQGYNGSTSNGTLSGTLQFQTVNGKTCNLPVVF